MQPEEEKPFRLLTWNINGLANTLGNLNANYKGLKGFFNHLALNAACLQETKMPESKQTKEVVLVDGFESFWAISQPPKTGYSGVTTYVQKAHSPVSAEVDNLAKSAADETGDDDTFDEQLDREGRVVITDLVDFVLINVYVPNAGDQPARPRLEFKCRFLEALKRKMDALKFAGREVVLVGDLNVAAEKQDVHPSINYDQLYHERELQLLHSMLSTYPDVWRRFHPDTDGCYTVWEERTNARSRNAGLRLDYVLVTPGLLDRLVSCEILYTLPPKWSDHVPMILELARVPPVPVHPPCALSSEKDRRFHDRGQAKISSMFAAAASQKKAGGGAGPSKGQQSTTAKDPEKGASGSDSARSSGGIPGGAGAATSAGGQAGGEKGAEGAPPPAPTEQQQQQQQPREEPSQATADQQHAPAASQPEPSTSSQQQQQEGQHQEHQQQQQQQQQQQEKEDQPGPSSSQEQPEDGHKTAGKRAASTSSPAAGAKKAKVQGPSGGKQGGQQAKKKGAQQQASPGQQKQQRSMTSFLQGAPKQT